VAVSLKHPPPRHLLERLVSSAVDLLLWSAVWLSFTFTVRLWWGRAVDEAGAEMHQMALGAAAALVPSLGLLGVIEAVSGASIGRRLVGFRVLESSGGGASRGRLALRSLIKYGIPALLIAFGGGVARAQRPGNESLLVVGAPLLVWAVANTVFVVVRADGRSLVDLLSRTRSFASAR
jgi:hypothetical protein